MGCSNSNMELNKTNQYISHKRLDDDLFETMKNKTIIRPNISNKKQITLDIEVINWKTKQEKDLIHRLIYKNYNKEIKSGILKSELKSSKTKEKKVGFKANINENNNNNNINKYENTNNNYNNEDKIDQNSKNNTINKDNLYNNFVKENNINKDSAQKNEEKNINKDSTQKNEEKNKNNNTKENNKVYNKEINTIKMEERMSKIAYDKKNNYFERSFYGNNKFNVTSRSNFSRGSRKKSKSIKNKKVPFIVKTISNNLGSVIVISINATFFLGECLIPIWFTKNRVIKFQTEGKWVIDEQYDYTDSRGIPNTNILNFNIGALIARIGASPSFMIPPNEFTYTTKFEGPLYLKINFPKNVEVCPEGEMEIKVYEGIQMTIEEIYEKIGWIINRGRDFTKEINELENYLILTFNYLRMDPTFYELGFINNRNKILTEDYLKKKFNFTSNESNNNKEINNYDIEHFIFNEKGYIKLNEFFNKSFNLKTKIIKNKIDLFLEKLQMYLCSTFKSDLKLNCIIKCKLTRMTNPVDICIPFLLDKNFIRYFFNNNYNTIAVKFNKNYYDGSDLIILAIFMIKYK